jgi:hypothetical protein
MMSGEGTTWPGPSFNSAALMAAAAPGMSQRLRPSGVGFREVLVGLPRDDASTAVDRRVEFKTAPCA